MTGKGAIFLRVFFSFESIFVEYDEQKEKRLFRNSSKRHANMLSLCLNVLNLLYNVLELHLIKLLHKKKKVVRFIIVQKAFGFDIS